jgi:hypothetical protein
MKLASCHILGNKNFRVVPRFFKICRPLSLRQYQTAHYRVIGHLKFTSNDRLGGPRISQDHAQSQTHNDNKKDGLGDVASVYWGIPIDSRVVKLWHADLQSLLFHSGFVALRIKAHNNPHTR